MASRGRRGSTAPPHTRRPRAGAGRRRWACPSRPWVDPMRATRSPSRSDRATRRSASRSSRSPTSWPSCSLRAPNQSRSTSSSANRAAGSRRAACTSAATCARRASMPGSPASGIAGVALGDVGQGAGEQRRAAGRVALGRPGRDHPAERAGTGPHPVLARKLRGVAGDVAVQRRHQRRDVVGVDPAQPGVERAHVIHRRIAQDRVPPGRVGDPVGIHAPAPGGGRRHRGRAFVAAVAGHAKSRRAHGPSGAGVRLAPRMVAPGPGRGQAAGASDGLHALGRQQVLDAGDEVFDVDRLGLESVAADAHRLVALVGLRVLRQRDHQDVAGDRIGLEPARRTPTRRGSGDPCP